MVPFSSPAPTLEVVSDSSALAILNDTLASRFPLLTQGLIEGDNLTSEMTADGTTWKLSHDAIEKLGVQYRRDIIKRIPQIEAELANITGQIAAFEREIGKLPKPDQAARDKAFDERKDLMKTQVKGDARKTDLKKQIATRTAIIDEYERLKKPISQIRAQIHPLATEKTSLEKEQAHLVEIDDVIDTFIEELGKISFLEKVPETPTAFPQENLKLIREHDEVVSGSTPSTKKAFRAGLRSIHRIAAAVTIVITGLAYFGNRSDSKSSERALPVMKPQNGERTPPKIPLNKVAGSIIWPASIDGPRLMDPSQKEEYIKEIGNTLSGQIINLCGVSYLVAPGANNSVIDLSSPDGKTMIIKFDVITTGGPVHLEKSLPITSRQHTTAAHTETPNNTVIPAPSTLPEKIKGYGHIIPLVAQNELIDIIENLSQKHNDILYRLVRETSGNTLSVEWYNALGKSGRLTRDNDRISDYEAIPRVELQENGGYSRLVGIDGKFKHFNPETVENTYQYFIDGDMLIPGHTSTGGLDDNKQVFACHTGEITAASDLVKKVYVNQKNWVQIMFGEFGQTSGVEKEMRTMVEAAMKKPDFYSSILKNVPHWFHDILAQDTFFALIPRDVIRTEFFGDCAVITFIDGNCFHKMTIPFSSDSLHTQHGIGESRTIERSISTTQLKNTYIPVGENGLEDAVTYDFHIHSTAYNQTLRELTFDVESNQFGKRVNSISHVTVFGKKYAVVDGKVTIPDLNLAITPDMLMVTILVKVSYFGLNANEANNAQPPEPVLRLDTIRYEQGGQLHTKKAAGQVQSSPMTLVHSVPHVQLSKSHPKLSLGQQSVATIDIDVSPNGDISLHDMWLYFELDGVKIDTSMDKDGIATALLITLNGSPLETKSEWYATLEKTKTLRIRPEKDGITGPMLAAGSHNTLRVTLPVTQISGKGAKMQLSLFDRGTKSSRFVWGDNAMSPAYDARRFDANKIPNFPLNRITLEP